MYKIGRLAQLADCQPVTIRYYEKEGLLEKPTRGENGYRHYGSKDLDRLRFIRHCRDHGINLADVKKLLKLRESSDGSCQPVGELIDVIIQRLEEQIKSIQKLKENLVALKERCHGDCIANCAILKGLSDRESCPCSEIPS
jgi:DNA-binding transcriptional MerR regulator